MSAYGNIEKQVANVANRFPWIKPSLKQFYQQLNYLLFQRPYDHKLAEGVSMKKISSLDNKGSFWGYYDSSPYFKGNFLFHSFEEKKAFDYSEKATVDILVNDKKVSETSSWNWQQGARLYWFDDQSILHNVFDGSSIKAKHVNIKTGKSGCIDSPVYAYHRPTKKGLGIDFKRLGHFDPAYGYPGHFQTKEINDDEEDGIFLIDIQQNKSLLIISFDRLKRFRTKNSMAKAGHSVNHLQFSPNGKRFIFVHRWYLPNGRKFSRLISADLEGKELFLLADEGMVSHCNWKNDNEIIGWMKMKNDSNAYYLLKDQTNNFNKFLPKLLNEDGHPSISQCGKYLLTDTYPDRSRMSHLLLINIPDQKLTILGSFHAPVKFINEQRCDLHPRFSSNNKITVDSVHKGVRQLYELDISKVI